MKISIEKTFFTIAILSLPFLNVFAISEKVSITLLIFSILYLLKINYIKYKSIDFLYAFFLINMILSTLINNYINFSSLLYTAAYFLIFLIFQKNIIYWYTKYKHLFFKILLKTVILTSIFVIYEFISINLYPKLFIELPRITVEFYDARFLRVFRPRGFAEESGHMSVFYEFSIPILIPYLKTLKKYKITIYLILISISILLLSSSYTIAISLLTLILFFIIKSIKKAKIIIYGILSLTILFSTLKLNSTTNKILDKYSQAVITKVRLNKTNSSVGDRNVKISDGIKVLKKNIITGIGAMKFKEYSKSASTLNTTLDLWLFSGLIGIISLILYFLISFINFIISNVPNKIYFLISFCILIIHYQIITNFWFPYLWLILGIMESELRLNKIKNVNESITCYQ
jgi:hypothetical protein